MWSNLRTELALASVDRGADVAALVDGEYIGWIKYAEARYYIDDDRSADLYLLALLGLVHGDAWRRRTKLFCRGARVDMESIEKLSHSTHLLLGFKANFASEFVLESKLWRDMTDRILQIPKLAYRRDDPSGHKAAEIELIRQINENGIDLSSMDLRVPIRIECDTSNGNLQHVMMLAMAQAARQLPTSGGHQRLRFHRHAAFRLHEVLLGYSSEMGWNELEQAKTIVQYGVRLCVFPPLKSGIEHVVAMEDALNALQVLFPSEPGSRVGVECARLSAYTPSKMIPALLSAVRASPSVRAISISPVWMRQDDPCDEFWRWMAYTLSGRGARHRIDSVRLGGAIEPVDIGVMQEIIQAANPLAMLYGGDASSKPGGTIEARRFQLLDPSTNSTQGQASAWTSSRTVEVDVITSGGVWWSVLLPGYGRAWVHQDNILRHTAHEQLPAAPSVSRFEYIYNSKGANELQWAIEMFGSSLISFSSKCDKHNEPESIERILVACPSLQLLILPSTTTLASGCLQIITQTARKLRSLEATIAPDGDASDLIHFFTTLSDENHACAIAFKTLRLCIVIKQDEDLVFASSYTRMMTENRTLTRVALTIEDRRCIGYRGDVIQSLLSISSELDERSREHLEVDAPVRLKCRLAFLSAMKEKEVAAMSRMDSAVLAKIFEFAVHRERRDVTFHYEMGRK